MLAQHMVLLKLIAPIRIQHKQGNRTVITHSPPMAITGSSPVPPHLFTIFLLPYLFFVVLLHPVAARPLLRAPPPAPASSCSGTEDNDNASCAALLKRRLCAGVCFPAARIPADTSLRPAPWEALAPALLSSSTEHLSALSSPSNSICFEKVAAVSYSGLIVAPGGSGRALIWNQQGKVWSASMPAAEETGATMPMQVGDSPFIDLSSLVRYDQARGLRGLVSVVFHPSMDGRLFVSYTTIKSDNDCGRAAMDTSAGWCAILVVKELSPEEHGLKATTMFLMDLPAAQAGFSFLDHGGQIFFRPNDPSLYIVTGHGASADFVSNKSSLLGKILRLHVDHDMPGTDAEVFFSGLNIPRGCALDYSGSLFCANIDETHGELVYLIYDNNPSSATSVVVLELLHPMAPGSIVWGLQYQGSAAASLSGRYIYAYNSAFWSTTVESAPSSGRYTLTRMVVACSKTSPMPCQDAPIAVSFAEDQNKEGVILATDGIYRIVASSLCAEDLLGLGTAPTRRHRSVGSLVAAVLGSVLGAMGTALLLAWVIWKKILQEDGKDSCPSIACSCCNDNTCIWCCC